MPVSASELVEVVQVGLAPDTEVERDRDFNVAFERFPLARLRLRE